jgi:hypothetical protein
MHERVVCVCVCASPHACACRESATREHEPAKRLCEKRAYTQRNRWQNVTGSILHAQAARIRFAHFWKLIQAQSLTLGS